MQAGIPLEGPLQLRLPHRRKTPPQGKTPFAKALGRWQRQAEYLTQLRELHAGVPRGSVEETRLQEHIRVEGEQLQQLAKEVACSITNDTQWQRLPPQLRESLKETEQ